MLDRYLIIPYLISLRLEAHSTISSRIETLLHMKNYVMLFSPVGLTVASTRLYTTIFRVIHRFLRYVTTVACRVITMQRPRDGRIYQGRFWATSL
jgi:hypothetical protein